MLSFIDFECTWKVLNNFKAKLVNNKADDVEWLINELREYEAKILGRADELVPGEYEVDENGFLSLIRSDQSSKKEEELLQDNELLKDLSSISGFLFSVISDFIYFSFRWTPRKS